jgi:hypothetical protein
VLQRTDKERSASLAWKFARVSVSQSIVAGNVAVGGSPILLPPSPGRSSWHSEGIGRIRPGLTFVAPIFSDESVLERVNPLHRLRWNGSCQGVAKGARRQAAMLPAGDEEKGKVGRKRRFSRSNVGASIDIRQQQATTLVSLLHPCSEDVATGCCDGQFWQSLPPQNPHRSIHLARRPPWSKTQQICGLIIRGWLVRVDDVIVSKRITLT